MIEEVKPKEKPKKRPNLFYRFLAFLVTVGLVAGAVGLVANRDKLNIDALRRWFSYRSTAQSDSGSTDPFTYEGGSAAAFSNVNGDLFSASSSGFRLYSTSGATYVEDTLTLSNPAYSVSGNTIVAYDAGGKELRVYRERSQVFSLQSQEGDILSARLSTGGWLAVVTRATGFKGVVTVYNPSFQKVIAFRLSSAYVMDAVVSPDAKTLVVLTAGQEGHTFQSGLSLYKLDAVADENGELTPAATLSLGNRIPLDLRWSGSSIRVLTEYGVVTANANLEATGECDWSERHLKQFSLDGDDFSAMLIGKYRAGSQAELALTDSSGAPAQSLPLTEQVLSLSAAGRYVALLTADRLDIYTKDLELYASLEGTQGARQVVMRPDGTAMLISTESAWLYIPI